MPENKPKPRRSFLIFLTPMHLVTIVADEMQFAGPCMILWRDDKCIAQFSAWQGWVEELDPSGNPPQNLHTRPELATVTNIRPMNAPNSPPGTPAPGAA